MEPQSWSSLRPQGPNQLGYALSHSEEARHRAVQDGFQLVNRLRRAGLDARAMAQEAAVKGAALVAEARQTHGSADDGAGRKPGADSVDARAQELQEHVVERFRRYTDEVNNVLGNLTALNPPLTAEQLHPFLEAALADRQTTLNALDPFGRMMELLRRWRQPG